MGFAMLLALPAMLFLGTMLDVATSDDHAAPDEAQADQDTDHGNLLDEPDATA
jgi:hypothetical protein